MRLRAYSRAVTVLRVPRPHGVPSTAVGEVARPEIPGRPDPGGGPVGRRAWRSPGGSWRFHTGFGPAAEARA
ncbi:hypothetical protein [Corynebacterium sp. CCM 9204]|uniref:hypothetical protein n=1 Tax=Corynebacterium sp. CCM 9204 TaxID=3057616 RepID=UPI00352435C0